MTRAAAVVGFVLSCTACGGTLRPRATHVSGRDAPPAEAPAHDTTTPSAPTGDANVVETDRGRVRGMRSGATTAFKGIPYAQPPIGRLRWRPPEPASAWSDIRDASGFGYVCMQSPSSNEPNATPMGSEDCLTLNVWTPAERGPTPLPVFFFVHGGFFTWGASSLRVNGIDGYDGAFIAEHAPAVVVTINYRLGPFGFLAHPALAAEDEHHASGDYGLMDQIAALEWVQRNIAAFGGDASHVLLFGQSAGAISTGLLYASPRTAGLFFAAAMVSGNALAKTRESGEALGEELATRVSCADENDVPGCLREKSASEIIAALPETFGTDRSFGPTVDGWIVPRRPDRLILAHENRAVPLLVSTTADEFTTMAHLFGVTRTMDEATFRAAIVDILHAPDEASLAPLFAAYPLTSYPSPYDAYIAIRSDRGFVCPSRALARLATHVAPGTVWREVFTHVQTGHGARLRAGHGMDLMFLFRNAAYHDVNADPAERALADEMLARYAAFARTGSPNTGQLLPWPAYDLTEETYMAFDTPNGTVQTHLRDAECDVWTDMLRRRR